MRIDKAERSFLESYNADMMRSIDEISKNLGLNENGHTLKGFNLEEAFDRFSQYLEGYAEYCIKNENNPNASTDQQIAESVRAFIETAVFQDRDLKYRELPGFVQGYISGCRKLTESVNKAKDSLMDAGLYEQAGAVNEFCEQFMERVDGRFHPAMDRILDASGYNDRVWLEGHLKGTRKPTEKIQFI